MYDLALSSRRRRSTSPSRLSSADLILPPAPPAKPVLPIYKVWLSTDDAGAKRKALKAAVERKAMAKQQKEREKDKLNARKGKSRVGRLVGM